MYKEIIIVEGSHDRQKLESIFPGIECIITNGSSVSLETIEAIKTAHQTRGVILFLDPDTPGKMITNFILMHIRGPKIAFLSKKDAISKNQRKVGIEHASEKAIIEALHSHFTVSSEIKKPIYQSDLNRWHLFGNVNSQANRQRLCEGLRIPLCNGKALIKWINRLEISLERIEEVMS
jgi:ribonuclease M5